MPIKAHPTFVNPYEGLEDGTANWLRVNVDVERDDIYRVRTVLPDHGAVQIAVCLFIKSLSEYVKSRNLQPLDPDHRSQLIQHILSITTDAVAPLEPSADPLQLHGGDSHSAGPATGGRDLEAANRDVGRGTSRLREGDTFTPNEQPARQRKPSRKKTVERGCE